ncbi:MAG TPA: hypothetical protein VL332_12600 [Candidatus Saccharimonadaceae bacterium]|nr:hypothetical protein [Candidatus Saccharimonadaceae bacterium]
MSPRSRALGAALLLVALGAPRAAHATAEEFSTFSVAAQEEDDESLLDHVLTRMPLEWRDDWERSPQGFRTSEGCLTSGQWFQVTDLKVRSPLGDRAELGVVLHQLHDNQRAVDVLSLAFRFPTRLGHIAVIFDPNYDKSRQDFTLGWQLGADTSAFQIDARFTIEDMLNNLWAFRQTRVGGLGEPYLRHPFEPQLRVVSRHQRWRAEVSGRWLTPSRRNVFELGGATEREQYLWGAAGEGSVEARAFGLEWAAAARTDQASSADQPVDFSSGDRLDYRRQWSGEATVLRRFTPRWTASAHWLYQARTELFGRDLGPGLFGGVDRLSHGEVAYRIRDGWMGRVGIMYDRIGIARAGVDPFFTYGSRKESRAYLGLDARFGRVSVSGVEGIELDQEPYEVTFHHDKGFLRLQTTF